MRLFGSVKTSEADVLSIDSDRGNPFGTFFAPMNAHKSRAIVFVSAFNVLHIQLRRYITKIAPAIVRSETIDVVNVIDGKRTSHVQERKPVHLVKFPVDGACEVSALTGGANNVTDFGAVAGADEARKQPGFRVVVQEFFEASLRKHLVAFHSRGCIPRQVSDRVGMSHLFGR